jgi:hypothetical protein
MKIRFTAIGTLAAACFFSTFSFAGTLDESKGEGDLEILFAPYLWAPSISGTSQVGALPPMDLDVSFSDILDNLEMAMSLHTEFHFGKFAFVLDPTYLSIEVEVETPGSLASPTATVDIWMVEAWGSYQLTDNLEVLGGARWQDQELEVNLGLPSPPFPGNDFSGGDDWLDWFVGARLTLPMGTKWRFIARGDVVVAGDSDSSYNVEVFLNRRIRQTMAVHIGYRYFKDDYDNAPTYVWDTEQKGPVIGYIWSF